MQIWTWLRQLFQQVTHSTPAHPVLHELIQRSEEEKQDYQHWKQTLVRRRLMDWLWHQYATFCVDPDGIDEAIDFLDLPAAKGFVIHLHHTRYSDRDARHLMDYLRERVRAIGYRGQLSDRRVFQRDGEIEQVERHYLKPRPGRGAQGKLDQGFGNILIQLTWRDDQLYHLTFQANTYNDYLFEAPRAFEGLMRALAAESEE